MTIPVWGYLLSMGGYFALLMVIIGVMRRYYKFASWFWLLTLLTFPIWLMSGGVEGWFRWFKVISVILPTIFLGFCRVANFEQREGPWRYLKKSWVLVFFYCILFLNIMEATIKDLQTGNIFNAACGLLLCVTMPYATKYWEFSKKPHGDLCAYTTVGWNFLYTTWNLCFVYGESPAYFASSLCILMAAEIYPIIKGRPELYIMARVYTLATHMILRSCFPWIFPATMNSASWFNPATLHYWGIANLLLILPYVFWHTWQLHTGQAEWRFRRMKPVVSQ